MRVLPILLIACSHPEAAPRPAEQVVPALTSAADAVLVRCPLGTPGAGATRSDLTIERWSIDATPIAGEACIDVVRADPATHRLRIYSDPAGRTADAWRAAEQLIAVTNGGMFHQGGAPVGLIVDRGTARGTDNAKFGGVVAWDPVDANTPAVTVTARQCAGFDLAALRTRYRSLVQSYRLLDCDGHALPWKDPKQYSSAALGVDRAGRIVFLHARGAVTMAELSTALAGHDLAGALFLEGGPEATLVAGSLSRVGSYETGFVENDDNHVQWALPNVIGLVAVPR